MYTHICSIHICTHMYTHKDTHMGFPAALAVGNPLANAGNSRDAALFPGFPGRSPGGRRGSPLQYSGLENPMDRGAWRATVHGVAESRTRLKQLGTAHAHAHTHARTHTHTYPTQKSTC